MEVSKEHYYSCAGDAAVILYWVVECPPLETPLLGKFCPMLEAPGVLNTAGLGWGLRRGPESRLVALGRPSSRMAT